MLSILVVFMGCASFGKVLLSIYFLCTWIVPHLGGGCLVYFIVYPNFFFKKKKGNLHCYDTNFIKFIAVVLECSGH